MAEQLEIPGTGKPKPVRLSLSVSLTGEKSKLWAAYLTTYQDVQPSNSQLAKALVEKGLEAWAKEKGL